MKRIITILIFFLVFIELNAQFTEKNAIYVTGEVNYGNYFGVNLNLNYISNERYSFLLGYSVYTRESKSVPDDFSSGLVGIFTLGLSQLHFDHMENYQILVGKIFESNKSGTIRLNIAGGIGYTTINEPTNWKRKSEITWGENYTYDINKHGTISLVINPKIEFPFTKLFGLTLSPMLQVNKDRTFIGIGIGAMVGLLRSKKN